jgi:hypothetical protein
VLAENVLNLEGSSLHHHVGHHGEATSRDFRGIVPQLVILWAPLASLDDASGRMAAAGSDGGVKLCWAALLPPMSRAIRFDLPRVPFTRSIDALQSLLTSGSFWRTFPLATDDLFTRHDMRTATVEAGKDGKKEPEETALRALLCQPMRDGHHAGRPLAVRRTMSLTGRGSEFPNQHARLKHQCDDAVSFITTSSVEGTRTRQIHSTSPARNEASPHLDVVGR